MWKLASALFAASLVCIAAIEGARACGGGGGGGCGAMGGGRAYGGRASASRKVLAGSPTVQAGQQVVRQQPASVANRVASTSGGSPAVRTVASKVAGPAKAAAKTPLYTCPMHPQVQWPKPTDCPLCGMQLKLKQPKTAAITRNSTASPNHAAMHLDETASESEAMKDMPGMGDGEMGAMDDMMMCPGCMMNMGRGKQAPAASQKATGAALSGTGCGC